MSWKNPYYRQKSNPGMNKTEEAFSRELQKLHLAGEIESWSFEACKFRLAPKTFYTPDFMVVFPNYIALYDVKPSFRFVQDDAAVKIKVAARLFPWFAWRLVAPRRGGGFDVKEIG
jgi:hypothetical protein